jgi:pyruvate kinase
MTRPNLDESRTKIVATVGPACGSVDQLAQLIETGVSVFRINTAHGTGADHQAKLDAVREASKKVGFEVAVLLDLAGPKIRLGELPEEPHFCEVGSRYTFVRGNHSDDPHQLTSSYPKLIDELGVGDRVMLADGLVAMKVEEVDEQSATCIVQASGTIRSRQGINLPGAKLSVSSMLPSDVENAIWAAKSGIDWISLSFVRSSNDVLSLKKLLATYESKAMVIAKIEKPEAMEDLEAIVDASDGIMVARGDLGVEIDVAETPMAQKRIIRICKRKVKPVIVATQMLESMHTSSRPTRAEASDVANAILDGADACMLSGETAIGDHPVKSVAMMSRIMQATEREMTNIDQPWEHSSQRVNKVTTAVTEAGISIAESIGAKMIVIATRSGNTAWISSQSRTRIPMVGISNRVEAMRRMNLLWGIKPLLSERLADNAELVQVVRQWSKCGRELQPGDQIVLVKGTGVVAKAHNTVVVHTIES